MCHFVVFVKSSRVTSIDFGVFFTKSSHRPDFFHLFTWSNVCVEGAEIVRCPIFSICFNLKCMKTQKRFEIMIPIDQNPSDYLHIFTDDYRLFRIVSFYMDFKLGNSIHFSFKEYRTLSETKS